MPYFQARAFKLSRAVLLVAAKSGICSAVMSSSEELRDGMGEAAMDELSDGDFDWEDGENNTAAGEHPEEPKSWDGQVTVTMAKDLAPGPKSKPKNPQLRRATAKDKVHVPACSDCFDFSFDCLMNIYTCFLCWGLNQTLISVWQDPFAYGFIFCNCVYFLSRSSACWYTRPIFYAFLLEDA